MTRVSLKRLLALNIGIVVGAIVLLVGGWLYSLSSLQRVKMHLYKDAVNLHVAQEMEAATSLAYQHYRFWHLTGQEGEHQVAVSEWHRVTRLTSTLPENVTTSKENALLQRVEARLKQLTKTVSTQNGAPDRNGKMQAATASLSEIVLEYRNINQIQMDNMKLAGDRIEAQTRLTSALLIIVALVAIAASSLNLWLRIFRPILALSQASTAFGEGGSDARAPILWDDEMGQLCRSFNDMTQSIAEREKERFHFVATVAHDLKSPLVVVGGAAQLLQKNDVSPADQKRWLQTIQRSAHSLERIIGDLTDRVQAQTGRLQLCRETFDFAVMTREIVQQYGECSDHRRVTFVGETAALVHGDRPRLERVLFNLLSNACKYSSPDSAVHVSAEARKQIVVLRVEDEGIGIAPEDVAQVFQPFSRLEEARAMAAGSGLGLSSARKIIEAHGGIIRLMSQPQHGTVVEVSLPQAS